MLRDEVLRKLREDKPKLDAFGVKAVGVFGSVARGEDDAESDIDIVVDYRPEDIPGLFAFVGLKQHLEELLGRRVDLATPDALHPALRDGILKEIVYA